MLLRKLVGGRGSEERAVGSEGPMESAPRHQNNSNLQSLLETLKQWLGRKQGVKET